VFPIMFQTGFSVVSSSVPQDTTHIVWPQFNFHGLLHIVKNIVVIFREVSFIHPFIPSFIYGWHHSGNKILK
jgi:hypothetical protein